MDFKFNLQRRTYWYFMDVGSFAVYFALCDDGYFNGKYVNYYLEIEYIYFFKKVIKKKYTSTASLKNVLSLVLNVYSRNLFYKIYFISCVLCGFFVRSK